MAEIRFEGNIYYNEDIAKIIETCKDDLVVYIDSKGGYAEAARKYYKLIKQHAPNAICKIQNDCMSAATIIASACKTREATALIGRCMFHACTVETWGVFSSQDLENLKLEIDLYNKEIVGYLKNINCSEKVTNAINSPLPTYFTHQEAYENGFLTKLNTEFTNMEKESKGIFEVFTNIFNSSVDHKSQLDQKTSELEKKNKDFENLKIEFENLKVKFENKEKEFENLNLKPKNSELENLKSDLETKEDLLKSKDAEIENLKKELDAKDVELKNISTNTDFSELMKNFQAFTNNEKNAEINNEEKKINNLLKKALDNR